jgi:hypothetical protein
LCFRHVKILKILTDLNFKNNLIMW